MAENGEGVVARVRYAMPACSAMRGSMRAARTMLRGIKALRSIVITGIKVRNPHAYAGTRVWGRA